MSRGSTQRDINSAEKARLALQLRKQGYALDDIALKCGYQDRSGAYRAIKRALDAVTVEDATDLKKIEFIRLERLEQIAQKQMDAMDAKENKDPLWAIDRLLKISEARRNLMGLDTPVKDVQNPNIVVVREIPPGYLAVEAKHE